MYAIVEILGTQVKVEPGLKIWVPLMSKNEPGEKLTFDKVMLVGEGEKIKIGQPLVEGASVKATLLDHTKGPKLIVFRKRRRKVFHKKRGHRQKYSVIKIDEIKG